VLSRQDDLMISIEAEQTGPVRERLRDLPTLDQLVLAFTLVFPMLLAPQISGPMWTPKAALLLVVVGPSLLLLWLLARRGDRAAAAAVVFVAVVWLSAVLSRHPALVSFGEPVGPNAAWMLSGFVGCWALTRSLSPAGVRWLPKVLVVSLVPTAVLGILQVTIDTTSFLAQIGADRAGGLSDNPVYFGGLMAAAAVLLLAWVPRQASGRWLVLAPLFGCALGVSGSRIALIAMVALVPFVGWSSWRRVGAGLALVFAGLAVAQALPEATTAGDRVEETVQASGFTARFEAWKAAPDAVADRPLLGWGPGQFANATTRYLGPEFVRAEGPDRIFRDAHNIVVELSVTVGVLGLVAAAVWLALASWRATRPLVLPVAVLGLTFLLQPLNLHGAVFACLALGGAVVAGRSEVRLSRPTKATAGALGAIGLAAGVAFLLTSVFVGRGRDGDLTSAQRAQALMPWSTLVNASVTGATAAEVLTGADGVSASDVVSAAERTVDRESDFYSTWNQLGRVQAVFGRDEELALTSFRTALTHFPWSVAAWQGIAIAGEGVGDEAAQAEAAEALCQLGVGECPEAQSSSGQTG
jgi:O-antigen ligase